MIAKIDGRTLAELKWLAIQEALMWGGPIDRGADHNPDCLPLVNAGLIEKQRRSDGCGGWHNGYVISEKGRALIRNAEEKAG